MSQVPPPPAQPYPTAPLPGGGPVPGPPAPAPKRSWFARHKVLTTLGALVVLVVAVGVAGGGSDDPAPATATPAGSTAADAGEAVEQPAAEAPAPAAEAPAGIGTPVRDGTFEFTVTSVEAGVTRVGSDLIGQDAQGQYVLVHLTVANIGTEAQYFSDSSQKAFDAQDRQFSADSAAGVYLDGNNTLLNQINPGNTVTGTVVYDVPADATLTRLELHDSPFSGGVEVALG
ncbi:DUF4352 domain-containing protein [Cellulosimicrobium cellulans]|uniref:DUF4352 domain-containing protein n=1 Tax=Cellulosimicrobium cellulans TaxID=1710 RepID=UPI00130DA401|nr:DUF4352 domain-containing protein [Cellulosimicrobium cellulans]